MSGMAFNAMMNEVDNFSYDQCVELLSRLSSVFKGKKHFSEAEKKYSNR